MLVLSNIIVMYLYCGKQKINLLKKKHALNYGISFAAAKKA